MTDKKASLYDPAILRVDLASGRLAREELEPSVARGYLGGCALGARYVYDEVPVSAGWSDPRDRLVILGGPLSGTAIAGTGGITVCAKGAMTGGAASTQAQGTFAAYLRLCGLLGLVFEGQSERWTYLLIDESGEPQLRDASHLLGKDTWETVDALVAELGRRERELSILSIGPAGENLVRWASIMGDRGHAAAHNGVGAVMGAKRLKAVVAVRGRQAVPVADKERLAAIGKELMKPVIARQGAIHYYGTLNSVHGNYATGNLPVKNYTTNIWDISPERFAQFTGPYIHEHFQPQRSSPCWACPNRHCQMLTIPDGPYAGMVVEEPEYEQFSAFSANLGVDDVASVMMLSNTVDRLGMDANEGGWVLSCAFECYGRGILTAADTDGLALRWGNAESARALMHKIARRQGLGDILAEGVRLATEKIGRGAPEVGVYTQKGATPRGHDHRARWTEMFDTCVSDSGALDTTLMMADLKQFGLPEKVGGFDPEMIALAEAKAKGAMQFEDSLVICRFNGRTDVVTLSQAVAAATGWEYTPAEAMETGRRATNTMRAFNLMSGIPGDLDRPSPRYGSTPVDGPAQGMAIRPHWEKMRQIYYAGMGWDAAGRPRPETLRHLGLAQIAADLWGTAG